MTSLILAVRFLTIVPVPGREGPWPGSLGRAAWWFPAVGLALGAVLAVVDLAVGRFLPPMVSAAVVVCAWAALTGALHLDGLADCLDGLAGATPERRLAIMRDSQIGVFGALGLIASFALAVASLAATADDARRAVLLVAPAVGRTAPLLAAARLAPAGAGLGAALSASVPRAAVAVNLAVVACVALLALGPFGVGAAAAALAIGFAAAAFFAGRIGGVTGDVLGAAVAITEVTCLVAAAAVAPAIGG